MSNEIKFQIIIKNKIDGYERLKVTDSETYWEWMCIEMNSEKRENWYMGVYPKGANYIRRQYTGYKDSEGNEIYVGDNIGNEAYQYIVAFEDGAFVLNHVIDVFGRWGLLSNMLKIDFKGAFKQPVVIGNIYNTKD